MKGIKDYAPEFFGLLFAIGLLNVWYLSGLAIEKKIFPSTTDYLVEGCMVMLGAFIGAFAAFKLKQASEERALRKKRKKALNKALFVIARQSNAIQVIAKYFAQYEDELERAFNLPANSPPDYSTLKQDFESLTFILETESPQTLMDLTIEQERFEQAISSIHIRNEFIVSEVQPALSYHALNGHPVPIEQFARTLGERLFQGAIHGAQVMYEHVEITDASLGEMFKKLDYFARKEFPGEKFVKCECKGT